MKTNMATHSQYAAISKNNDVIDNIKNVNVIGIQKESSISDVMLSLVTNKISKIFVFDKYKPVGIITDKDIIRFLFIDKSGRDIHDISAQEIMNNICFTVGSLTSQQAAQMMLINKISTLGIGSSEQLDGIITKTDLIQHYIDHGSDELKVVDYMTISYFSASANDKLHQIIKMLVTCDVSRVVITDDSSFPIGVITNGDIFRATMETCKMNIVQTTRSNYAEEDGLWSETGFVGAKLAGEVMTEDIISVNPSMSMKTAAKILLNKKIDSLGINNDGKNLVGLLNKTNVLYAMAKIRGYQ